MIEPSQRLEGTIRTVHAAFTYAKVPYWLCFGGLWGLCKNFGIIPDGDLDLCTYHGEDYKKLAKVLQQQGYTMDRCMLDDTDPNKAVYASFQHDKLIHFCLSFWVKHGDRRYYCHDTNREIQGIMAPKNGYFFKGMPADLVDNPGMFRLVEWPGVNQMFKIRVPRLPGAMLDECYPDWAYQKQRYNISNHTVVPEKMVSYHKGGALSRWRVTVSSMAQWKDEGHVQRCLDQSLAQWFAELKMRK
jgi:hypothetical protein